MDPLTHMLTGAAVADATGASKTLGNKALAFSMVLAAMPDIDFLPALVAAFPANPFSDRLFDANVARLYHRGYTHALPLLTLAGIVFGAAAWRWLGEKKRLGLWLSLAVAALYSHTLLDMANGAVRLWLPFDGAWRGMSQAVEGSPLIIGALLICFLANHPPHFKNSRNLGTLTLLNAAGARLNSAIGSRIAPRRLAIITLSCVSVYLLADMLQ